MLKSYLRIAFRNLFKHRTYSAINILGLAIGLTCFILIMLYVKDELSYDRYHSNADRIFRIAVDVQTKDGLQQNAQTPPIWTTKLIQDFPEIEKAVRFKPPRQKWMVNYQDRRFTERGWAFADSSVFEMFDWELTKGNPGTVLSKPFTVVISEAMAHKYFGEEDPVGKTITLDNQYDFGITGVMKNMRRNSHFHYDFLASFISMTDPNQLYLFNVPESNFPFSYNYVELGESAYARQVEEKFPGFIEQHVPGQFRQGGVEIKAYLQPVTDIHLYSSLENEIEANGDISTIYIFTAIAIFILLIACINFMNLATARSTGRSKEVGLRKVVGAFRWQIAQQFLGESVLLAVLSLMISIVLVIFFLPFFNLLTGKQILITDLLNPLYLLALAVVTVLTGILSGSYPSVFLAGFRPIDVLRGELKIGSSIQTILRKTLIIFQFSVSIILIICTGVVFDQLDFVRNKKLGFEKEHVVVIQLTDPTPSNTYPAFKDAILQIPNVINVSASMSVPAGLVGQQAVHLYGQSREELKQVQSYATDFDFINTMGMELIAGRDFSREYGSDSLSAMIINETAARSFGWSDPNEALEQGIQFAGNNGSSRPFKVIGVVKDFHSKSFREKIAPTIMTWANFRFFALVRIGPGDIPATLQAMRERWERMIPGYTFDYSFLDDDFDKLYRLDDVLGRLLGNFAMLAVFVACLGLFGLASYTAVQRTKEIGVRKVLGATVPDIVLLLSKDFARLVTIAFIAATPVAYYFMSEWLKGFAYGIQIRPMTFLYAGVLAILIALLTVSFQSIKSAVANPVKSLRYE